MSIRTRISFLIRTLVAICSMAYLMYSVGFSTLGSLFLTVNPYIAFITFLASLFLFFLGSINLWLLVLAIKKISYIKFLNRYVFSYMISLFLPGQLGDASLAIFLKKEGISYNQGTLAYSVDKGITAFFLFSVSWFGIKSLYSQLINPIGLIMIPLIGLTACIGIGALIWLAPCQGHVIQSCRKFITDTLTEGKVLRKKWYVIPINIALTTTKWLVMSFTFFLGFYCFGVEAHWPAIGVIPVLSTLAGYIPVSIGGIGTVELSAVYLFSLVSVDKTHVLGVYLLLRLFTYIQASLVLLFYIWKERFSQ